MTFPAYLDYRDSGVEWLGAVPTYWESWKISHAFGELGSGTTPPTSEAEWYEDGTVPWVTTGELRESVIWETKKLLSSTALSAFSALRLHPAGSLAIAMYGATIGRLGILGVDATTNQACCLLTRPNHLHVKFTFYWLLVFKQSIIDLYASGGGQPNINQEIIANLKVPAPSVREQIQIARFLDHETARIDALIEEQQRLIELLKEKRQAVISHAITKGLDPKVPMKDSGVEWLGEVPAHWRHNYKLGAMADASRGGFVNGPFGSDLLSSELTREGVPVVYIRDVKPTGYFRKSTDCVTEEKARQLSVCRVLPGDVLVAKVGSPPGDACIYPGSEPDGIVTQDVVRIRVNPEVVDAEYLVFLLNSHFGRTVVDSISVESTRKRFSLGDYKQLKLPLPPLAEQTQIARTISTQFEMMDALLSSANEGVLLIQERRSALISAAVTGKIDVRGWQPPASAPTTELVHEAV